MKYFELLSKNKKVTCNLGSDEIFPSKATLFFLKESDESMVQ